MKLTRREAIGKFAVAGIIPVASIPGKKQNDVGDHEQFIHDVVTECGVIIKFVKNPTEKLAILAVEENPAAIQYIVNPSLKVQLAAVNIRGSSIEYIENLNYCPFVSLYQVGQNRLQRLMKIPYLV